MVKTLILGMGNSILSDDAVGLKVAEVIYQTLGAPSNMDLKLVENGGMDLLEVFIGYDRLFVIDAIKTEKVAPGTVVKLDFEGQVGSHRITRTHDISLFDCIAMGRKLGKHMPSDIKIFCIELKENEVFSEQLSPEIEDNMENIVKEIIEEIEK
jgi:hydrogenase maturation protease